MKTKKHIQITGFPRIVFAHTFCAETYQNKFDFPGLTDTMLEITYVSEGELHFFLPDETIVTAERHAVICNLYTDPLFVRSHARHEHHTVCCRLPFRIRSPEESQANEGALGALCLPFITPPLPEKNPILPLIDEIILAHTMHTKGPLYCAGLILQLLDRLDGMTRVVQDLPAYHNRKYVKKAKQYIFEHLREPIRQTDIAAALGISPEYLCSVFKQVEGVPIVQFINRIKLEQIRQLMENNGFTLADASELYGFSDPNYVSRLHKKYYGFNVTDIKKGRLTDGGVLPVERDASSET